MRTKIIVLILSSVSLLAACASIGVGQLPVGKRPSQATSADSRYISWHEHIVDDPVIAGFNLSGSDGLVMADLDRDGIDDIVSVHESDDDYDSAVPGAEPDAAGHVRVAFGSRDPMVWTNVTLAEGALVSAPEDVATADLNRDGYLDVIVAAELGHLTYLQNPGEMARTAPWLSNILPQTRGSGSWIRVFAADFDGDGTPEISGANKGVQRPAVADYLKSTPASVFSVTGDPLTDAAWSMQVLGNYSVPQNAEPVDLDLDGDPDIVVGTRGERRLVWFENVSVDGPRFVEHAIGVVGPTTGGFNLVYLDVDGDDRLDILGASANGLVWLRQPENIDDAWVSRVIGDLGPDTITGIEQADINGDGRPDIMVGSYSRGPRLEDGKIDESAALGRLAWFEQPADVYGAWPRHDVSRRVRGMFDKFVARDINGDGLMDFVGTRGNSAPFDGVFWLEQVRTGTPAQVFVPARRNDSPEVGLPLE